MTGQRYGKQPYSRQAYDAAREADLTGGTTEALLDAAHDRKALGLDASVCARIFLNEITEWLRREGEATDEDGTIWGYLIPCGNEIADALLAQFGDPS